jgi:hypothetical protein
MPRKLDTCICGRSEHLGRVLARAQVSPISTSRRPSRNFADRVLLQVGPEVPVAFPHRLGRVSHLLVDPEEDPLGVCRGELSLAAVDPPERDAVPTVAVAEEDRLAAVSELERPHGAPNGGEQRDPSVTALRVANLYQGRFGRKRKGSRLVAVTPVLARYRRQDLNLHGRFKPTRT